ncbi:hypothetical protein [Halorussus halophilus]|uniref:hypothetical protein n=1 Tax=Halorussus halophilus TaxID=2650975 RepID=UPI0013016470|nr:hypothetical protein [Halorussus halophilus]
MRERTPLPPSEQRALALLDAAFESEEGRTWEDAQAVLAEDGYTEVSADELLQSLENRGYIYTVEGDVWITE